MDSGEERQTIEEVVRALTFAIEGDDLATMEAQIAARPEVVSHARPLLEACWFGSVPAARLLLDAGADVNAASRPSGGERPLSRVCEFHERGAWHPPHRAVAELLAERGADPAAVSHEGDQTPLLIAAGLGNREAVGFLVELLQKHRIQPDVWESASLGDVARIRKALLLDPAWAKRVRAAGSGHFHMRWTLIGLVARSCLGNHDEETADHLGDIAELLVEAGSLVGSFDSDGEEVSAPVAAAAKAGNVSVLKVLLRAGGVADEAFAHAIQSGQNEILETLKGYPLDLNQLGNPKTGSTLLHELALWGRFTSVRWMLEHGATPSPTDNRGMTPLHYAVRRGCDVEAVKLFLQAGADPWIAAGDGQTVVDLARAKKRTQLLAVLEATPPRR